MREVQFVGEIDFELGLLGKCAFLGRNLINAKEKIHFGQLIIGGQDGSLDLYQSEDFSLKDNRVPSSFQGMTTRCS